MRPLLTCIVILCAIAASSCSKNKKACWGCVLVFSDGYVASYRDSLVCDKTYGEIQDMKRQVFDASAMGYKTYELGKCSKVK